MNSHHKDGHKVAPQLKVSGASARRHLSLSDPDRKPEDAGHKRKFLVACDGSESSERALDILGDLLVPARGDMAYILAVVPHTHRTRLSDDQSVSHERQEHSSSGKDLINAAKERLVMRWGMAPDVMHDLIVASNEVKEAVVETAEQLPADYVILGTRGRGILKTLVLGSVSSYVLHHCKCPVIVVH
eukprot:Clim_evm8s230 gene=Clim_evmTU8s230